MTTVARTRDIVDPARLGAALAALIPDEGAATPATRDRMLVLLKAALEVGAQALSLKDTWLGV